MNPDAQQETILNLYEKSMMFCRAGDVVKLDPSCLLDTLEGWVMDSTTQKLSQVVDLYDAVNCTTTATGSATLLRSLIRPPRTIDETIAKQAAVVELQNNQRLRDHLTHFLEEIRDHEQPFYWMISPVKFPYFYGDFKSTMQLAAAMGDTTFPQAHTPYLAGLIDALQDFQGTHCHNLTHGPIYRTLGGLKAPPEMSLLTPRARLRPSFFTLLSIGPPIAFWASFIAVMGLQPQQTDVISSLVCASLYSSMTPLVKFLIDRRTVFDPMRELMRTDQGFAQTIDAVGRLDELASFVKYAEAATYPTTLPTILDRARHSFAATDLRNPVLIKQGIPVVANDIVLQDARVTIVTGPNSGGKTTLGKTVAQAQLLGQIGSYVPASSAAMSLADLIAYQYYEPDTLQNAEGDFGVNLRRTREIFEHATPRSLVILNTLASGTTAEEELEHANYIMKGFNTLGCSTVLVTHNHQLAAELQSTGIGQYLQAEFDHDRPTYRMIPGISYSSHASSIASRIGFSEKEVAQSLLQRGYV